MNKNHDIFRSQVATIGGSVDPIDAQGTPDPVMIRVYHEGCKGATAFFRNRPFLDEFTTSLSAVCGEECNVLVHASSVGSEPYSLALWWLHRGEYASQHLKVYATDLNPAFLETAQRGIYPATILEGMTAEERSWFESVEGGVRVPDKVREMVTFLPAMSFVDGIPGGSYDAVLVMNALTYVSPEQQATAIQNLSTYARYMVALTAFHPDTIRQDIQRIGFRPHLGRLEEIHSAWGDRLSEREVDPDSAAYSWRLPPFNANMPEYEYRFCAIFDRVPQVSEIQPELQHALNEMMHLAIQRHQSGDMASAETLYGKVLEFSPSNAAALHNLGLIYLERGDVPNAALLLAEAVQQNPAEATFNYNYALALQQQGRLPQAAQYYALAVKLRPDYRAAWENLGVVLQDLEQLDEAIEAYGQALKLEPCSRVANRNLGNALRVVGRLDDALTHYRQAVDCGPLDADIVFGLGATLLTSGDYRQGWPLYEWRFWSGDFLERNPPYRVPLPRWDGSDLQGKSLLVYAEQGVGDEIMFASCLQEIADRAQRLTLLCEPRLVPLFARSFANVVVLPREGDQPPSDQIDLWRSDCCVALGSLPGQVRLSAERFPGKPFLAADQQKVHAWQERLAALGGGLKIGISWRGGVEARARYARSIALDRFAPLFERSDVTFVNVQYGHHHEEIEAFNRVSSRPLVSFPEIDPLQDMDEFAALLSALDLVVTVDNSTVHLAGALGVPAWLLLPSHADWRWLKGQERTPWYASVRVFWQRQHGDAAWDEVILRLRDEFDHGLGAIGARDMSTVPEYVASGHRGVVADNAGPRALLLNDTAYWYHWGCTATSLALHEGIRGRGYRVDTVAITTFNTLAPLPASLDDFDDEHFFQRFCQANPDLVDRIRRSDVVLINGEGTLHGLGRAAVALLYTAYLSAYWLKKNTQIVNHSCYPTDAGSPQSDLADQIYRKVYRAMDYVAVREGRSAQDLARLGIQVAASFDCLPLYVAQHFSAGRTRSPSKRVVMAGSVAMTTVLVDTMVQLADLVISLGYELQLLVGANAYLAADDVLFVTAMHRQLRGRYTLVDTHTETGWLETIADAALLISGRFHHTIAAASLATPVAVAASNTQKMEGMLERLGLSPEDVWLNLAEPQQTMEKVKRLLEQPERALLGQSVLSSLCQQANLNFSGLPTVKFS